MLETWGVIEGFGTSWRVVGAVVAAVACCIGPLPTLTMLFSVVVFVVAAVAAGRAGAVVKGVASESCSDSLDESPLVLDDWLVCWGEDTMEADTTEEEPSWLLFDEEQASDFTRAFPIT